KLCSSSIQYAQNSISRSSATNLRDDPVIQSFIPKDDFVRTKTLFCLLSGVFSHRIPKRWLTQYLNGSLRHGLQIPNSRQKTVQTVSDHLRYAANSRSNHRNL